jgi:hypothetical protein
LQGEATGKLHVLTEVHDDTVAYHLFIKSDGFLHVGNRQQRAFEL